LKMAPLGSRDPMNVAWTARAGLSRSDGDL
jgi:hypothetical protein